MGFKEFNCREEMLQYESDRLEYYKDWISLCNIDSVDKLVKFYKMLLLEKFHPKYRGIRKQYDGYCGGWYRNERGWACSESINYIDINAMRDGDVGIETNGELIYKVYIFRDGSWIMISPTALEHLRNGGADG